MKTRVRKRAWKVLPPVGGTIPLRVVLDALLGGLTQNPASPALGELLVKRTGIQHWIFTNSGRSALSVVVLALRELYPDRDEVVIPAYTSYSVAAAVVRAGLRVQLCDVEMETLGISPKALERVFTPETLCVIPDHLYGVPCQIKAICEIARDYGIQIIEDAAQALGAQSNGHQLGTFGEAGIYSLSRGKALPAAGGGLLGTNNERLSKECQRILENISGTSKKRVGIRAAMETALMATFIHPSLYWLPARLPFLKLGASIYNPQFEFAAMSRFQGAVASRLLPNLPTTQALREETANRLHRALGEVKSTNAFSVVWPKEGDKGGYLRVPILVRDRTLRDRLLAEFGRLGLGATGGYPSPLSEITALRPHLVNPDDKFPISKQISEQLITLPTHPWVSESDIETIGRIMDRCLG